MLKKQSTYLAYAFTPPAVILNFYNMVMEHINIVLIVAISAASLVFWCVSIKTNKVQRRRHEAAIAAAEAEERYYEMLSEKLRNEKK